MEASTKTTPQPFWQQAGSTCVKSGTMVGAYLQKKYRMIDPSLRTYLGDSSLLALSFLSSRKTPDKTLSEDGRRLIIFVHGLGGHRGNFLPMQKYFSWKGRTKTLSIGFPDTTSIEVMAAHLKRTLVSLVADENVNLDKGVDLVTHSMGGIVARLALEDVSFAAHIHTLVTLATPHEGTHLARYIHSMKIKELRPESELLRRLSKQMPFHKNPHLPRLICFWTPKDLILLPPQSAIAPGAESVCIPDASHLGFLVKPKIWDKIFECLAP